MPHSDHQRICNRYIFGNPLISHLLRSWRAGNFKRVGNGQYQVQGFMQEYLVCVGGGEILCACEISAEVMPTTLYGGA